MAALSTGVHDFAPGFVEAPGLISRGPKAGCAAWETRNEFMIRCTTVSALIDGMVSLGFDVALTRHGGGGQPWRALFYPSSFIHERVSGQAWAATPWKVDLPVIPEP